MTAVIIPIKTPLIAKKRLEDVLTPTQRAGLVLAMLQDVLVAVSALKELTVWVVSNDHTVLETARQHDAMTIYESSVGGYNAAVELGLSHLRSKLQESTNVAILPGDVPLVCVHDLARLTAKTDASSNTVRLAPSHDGDGTNGLFLCRADLLSPQFGQDSYRRYRKTSLALGLSVEDLGQTTLAFDIDRPDDLRTMIELDTDGATGHYLRSFTVTTS